MNAPYTVKWYPIGKPEGRAKKFVEGLSPQCAKKLDKLTLQLAFRGERLADTEMMKHIEDDVWELREICDGGALRVYLFRDRKTFYLTNGEVKKSDKANRGLIDQAQKYCDDHKGKGQEQ